MAAIDFPSNPTVGQEYPFGEFVYVWDGVKWTTKVIVGDTADDIYVNVTGDTMTGDLTISSGKQLVAQTFKTNGSTYEFYPKDGETNKDIYWDFHASSENIDYSHRITFNSEDSTVVFSTPVLTSASQSSSASSLTRKDYVDGAFVKKSGDTMTGPLYFNILHSTESDLRVIHPYAENITGIYWGNTDQWSRIHAKDGLVQATDGTSIWRVYHQGFKPTAADVGALPITGGVITDNLVVQGNVNIESLTIEDVDTDTYMSLVRQGDQAFTFDMYPDGSGAYQVIKFDGLNRTTNFVQNVGGVTPTAPEHLTRKDYVDGNFVAKSGGTVTGPVTSNVADNWRIAYGGYGAFWRQDGSNLYLMLTNQGDQNGSYNNLRPFRVNCLNGSVVIGQGLILTAPQQAEPDSATRKDYVDSTVVAAKEELEATIATLLARIETLEAQVNPAP